MIYNENCPLCKLIKGNIITKKYYEDDEWLMVSCETCKVPMLVYKEHLEILPERFYPFDDFARYLFEGNVSVCNSHDIHYVDTKMKKIPSHFHCHYRRC